VQPEVGLQRSALKNMCGICTTPIDGVAEEADRARQKLRCGTKSASSTRIRSPDVTLSAWLMFPPWRAGDPAHHVPHAQRLALLAQPVACAVVEDVHLEVGVVEHARRHERLLEHVPPLV
jgi:hypothetical protein